MLRVLLAKDLRRAWRNPLPWLINIIVPLSITGLIGLAFGGKSDNESIGRIRFAIVDEDKSPLTGMIRGAASQGEAAKYLDPVFLDRETALRQITENDLSAAVIIPTNFTRDYFTGREVKFELVKNPAQSIYPALIEEMFGVVVTGLNTLSRNFQSEFPEWQAVIEGKSDYRKIAELINRAGNKIQAVGKLGMPPWITLGKQVRPGEPKKDNRSPASGIFAYLLVGMAAMFLLFLAANVVSDLHRELRNRTFERYHTLHAQLLPFIASKVVYAVVLLLLVGAVLLGGGTLIFRIHWQQPLALAILVFGYACFAAALMSMMVALIAEEHRADSLNSLVSMVLGLAGGCAFPPERLPTFLRTTVTPHLPSYWFVETARALQYGGESVSWGIVVLKLLGAAVVFIALATLLFRRRFKMGTTT